MKKKFLFVFAMLCALTITGCKDDENKMGTLSAPQEVVIMPDNGRNLIIFDEVANAEYYHIYINDISVTVKATGTGTIQFDASKIMTLPQRYTVKVKASGDKWFDSEFVEAEEYIYQSVLDAPVIRLDGTVVNWDRVPNAEFYDVKVKTTNPVDEKTYRVTTNKFNFAGLLNDKGDYTFKVCAESDGEEYLTSIYSNQVVYKHKQQLITPHSLHIEYSIDEYGKPEALLSFVSSANVTDFILNINGTNYNITEQDTKYIEVAELENVYTIKLASFARYKELVIDNENILTVSVKATTNDIYLISSGFSNTITCQLTSVLEAPRLATRVSGDVCQMEISCSNSVNLSAFAIYLNGIKYKTISSSVRALSLPLSEVKNFGIRVQAISNNNNCYSSNLSNVAYANTNLMGLEALEWGVPSFDSGILYWKEVDHASMYCVEIYNKMHRYNKFITDATITSLDVSNICVPGSYSVKIIAMADGYRQVENNTDIIHTTKLSVPTNISLNSDTAKLHFDKVEDAYGYVLSVKYQTEIGQVEKTISQIFLDSPINLTPYITEASGYTFKIKAVGNVNSYAADSEFSQEFSLQNVITLSTPKISIIKRGADYYLQINASDSEKHLIGGYEIWIDYMPIQEVNLVNGEMLITSYLTSAGQHSIIVKALAIDNNYVKDSNTASDMYDCYKQLDTVTNIWVTHLAEESKYILTFDEQTLAAQYKVKIVKADDEDYNVEFITSRGVADISQYVVSNGVYRIYVQAVAREGGFYLDSATGGNPYRLEKNETLDMAKNIKIERQSNGDVCLIWDSVENSSGYRVEVYYTEINTQILQQVIYVPQSANPSVNISSGEYSCLTKEGAYTIQIKALGESGYESSQNSPATVGYSMKNASDFERNIVFMYGNKFSHKISNAEDLKNLIWYHYLYNHNVLSYNSINYNLKIYCDVDLDTIAGQISQEVADAVGKASTNAIKMDIIGKALLMQYPEVISYGLEYVDKDSNPLICLNEEENIYIFRYDDNKDDNKTQTIVTSNKIYNSHVNMVNKFDQRDVNYQFAIDQKDSINVTTTEQLFMALQYNKQPNFVGNSAYAQAVYNNAKFILRQICSDNMSDYEKVLQIYDFVTKRIALNHEIIEQVAKDEDVYGLRDLFLEGVLYNYNNSTGLFYDYDKEGNEISKISEFKSQTATSQGLAKLFVTLCSIEGIDSIKVNGLLNGVEHSWNKVYIDIPDDNVEGKNWFVIDLARAINDSISIEQNQSTTTYQATSHKYFLTTDIILGATITSYHKSLGANASYVANTTFDYYSYQTYSGVYNGTTLIFKQNFVVDDGNDIEKALIYAMLITGNKDRVMIDVDAEAYINGFTTNGQINVDAINNQIHTIQQNAMNALNREYLSNVYFSIIDSKYIVLCLEPLTYNG